MATSFSVAIRRQARRFNEAFAGLPPEEKEKFFEKMRRPLPPYGPGMHCYNDLSEVFPVVSIETYYSDLIRDSRRCRTRERYKFI